MTSVSQWTTTQVGKWLKEHGFQSYVHLLCTQHKIDGVCLLTLTEQDLKQPPIALPVLGDIKRLTVALKKLQNDHRPEVNALGLENGGTTGGDSVDYIQRRLKRFDSEASYYSDAEYENRIASRAPPEYFKLVLSYLYMFSVFMLTALVMVWVNDRVPDSERYPPLPDLMLDNMPYVPWAFEMCELCALILTFILGVILFFHKHRFIIMRRLFALTGTVFLLRCVTMMITSLSVPGEHLKCHPEPGSSMWSKAERAFVIWSGFGMSMQGVRTCGDYMFSGHTVTVTMLNFFITEYSTRRVYWLHTATWVLNMFGIFFILAAHEHYSIDVFVAFYITSRLFLYYHTLANNKALKQGDRQRTRIWFPMFSYFESKVDGMVPNVYEWPLPYPRSFKEYFINAAKKRRYVIVKDKLFTAKVYVKQHVKKA